MNQVLECPDSPTHQLGSSRRPSLSPERLSPPPCGAEEWVQHGDLLRGTKSEELPSSNREGVKVVKGIFSAPPRRGRRFKGVRRRRWGRWVSEIRDAIGKRVWLECYDSEEEAARVYDAAARILQGETAWLNFPEEVRVDLPAGTVERLVEHRSNLRARMTQRGDGTSKASPPTAPRWRLNYGSAEGSPGGNPAGSPALQQCDDEQEGGGGGSTVNSVGAPLPAAVSQPGKEPAWEAFLLAISDPVNPESAQVQDALHLDAEHPARPAHAGAGSKAEEEAQSAHSGVPMHPQRQGQRVPAVEQVYEQPAAPWHPRDLTTAAAPSRYAAPPSEDVSPYAAASAQQSGGLPHYAESMLWTRDAPLHIPTAAAAGLNQQTSTMAVGSRPPVPSQTRAPAPQPSGAAHLAGSSGQAHMGNVPGRDHEGKGIFPIVHATHGFVLSPGVGGPAHGSALCFGEAAAGGLQAAQGVGIEAVAAGAGRTWIAPQSSGGMGIRGPPGGLHDQSARVPCAHRSMEDGLPQLQETILPCLQELDAALSHIKRMYTC